jgi:predicted permease
MNALLDSLLQDLRFAVRMLARARTPALLALLVLGLGIGANTAIFTVVSSVLLRPLPYSQPEQLVTLKASYPGLGFTRLDLSEMELEHLSRAEGPFAALAYSRPFSPTLAGEQPERVRGSWVSPSLLPLLGVAPVLGRAFEPGEGGAGGPAAVLLTDRLWRRRFDADPAVVGRTVSLDGRPYTVVGVMGPTFEPPMDLAETTPTELLVARTLEGAKLDVTDHSWLALARLAPGATEEQVQRHLGDAVTAFSERYPTVYAAEGRFSLRALSLHDDVVGPARPILWVLLGAVALVLLSACANVANLLLSRAEARRREMAVRTALGAGRGRLVRQLLVESTLLALLGGALGLLLAVWAVDLLAAFIPSSLPRGTSLHVDGRVLAFTLGITLLTGVVAGLAPALRSGRLEAFSVLKLGSSVTGGGARQGLGRALVVAQVALALVVLVLSGLLLRSFQALRAVDPGFRTDGVLTFSLQLPEARYPEAADADRFWAEVRGRLAALPEVLSAEGVSTLPLSGANSDGVVHVEGTPFEMANLAGAQGNAVTGGYFATLGIPVLEGRALSEADGREAPLVVVLNQTLARQLFPDGRAVGKRLQLMRDPSPDKPYLEVVGVVADVRNAALGREAKPEAFVSMAQFHRVFGLEVRRMTLLVRGEAGVAVPALVPAARTEVRALDAGLPLVRPRPLTEVVEGQTQAPLFQVRLFGTFAALALVLGTLGIYGVLSYWVSRQRRELGLRMALGARQEEVVRLVVGMGMRLALLGIAVGAAVSAVAARSLSSLLYGVSATDVVAYGAGALVLAGAALLASWLPAWRATRIDPLEALRAD